MEQWSARLAHGIWHYKKITDKHSVSQVQNRDRLKMKAIEDCGFKPYVIKDMGKANSAFVQEKFEEFIAETSTGR